MAKTVEQALQEGELFTDNQTYTYLKMPVTSISKATNMVAACSGDFRTLMLDKDEVTLMISSNDYEAHREKLVDDHVEVGRFAYRLITFDVVMDPTLIGFMATVTKALAAAQISVLPFAAYSRDHIFVSEDDYPNAMKILEGLTAGPSRKASSLRRI
jgi:hypothetical protein